LKLMMTSQNSVESNRSIFAIFDNKRIEFLFSEYSDSCSLWIGIDGTMGDLALAIPAPGYNTCYSAKLITRTTSAVTVTLAQIMALKMQKQVFVSTALDTSNSKLVQFVIKYVLENLVDRRNSMSFKTAQQQDDDVQKSNHGTESENTKNGSFIDVENFDVSHAACEFSPDFTVPKLNIHEEIAYGKTTVFDVIYVETIEEFYIQPISAKDKYFFGLHELLQKMYSSAENLIPLPIEISAFERTVYGVVKYFNSVSSDGMFMRCQVLNIVDMEFGSTIEPKTVRVKLIDYGKNYITSVTELYQIEKRICNIPCFTYKCHLDGVVRVQRKDPEGKNFFADNLRWFRSVCTSADVLKGFVDYDIRMQSLKVLMFAKKGNWQCINELLVQRGYGRPVENSVLLSWNMLLNKEVEHPPDCNTYSDEEMYT
ncbi:hypothetical protein T07_14940, partial [Trichinella nelsoni]